MTARTNSAHLLRIPEACEHLNISRSSLYNQINAGRIAVVHIGRSVRIPLTALEAFVASLGGDLDA
jgi:excisionase family DNA binding protein